MAAEVDMPEADRVRPAHLHFGDGAWRLSESWLELTLPGEGGAHHHGSRGSRAVETIELVLRDEVIARCDSGHLGLENLVVWDSEYYFYLRIREVVRPAGWAAGPWAAFAPGNVVYACDKFHDLEYLRDESVDPELGYGGDWEHLEEQVQRVAPSSAGLPRPRGAPKDGAFLDAVRSDDLARVKALLARGANPNAGIARQEVPALVMNVSMARGGYALWESVMGASPAITEALLAAGATVDWCPPGGLTVLVGAIINGRVDHLALLLRFGASLEARYQGQTAIELAHARGIDLRLLIAR